MTAGPARVAGRPAEVTAEKILDAAERLFAEHDPGSIGMADVARAAGCSRATLYRHFDNRAALHGAYVNRWATALAGRLESRLADVDDPRRRLVTGITDAVDMVRENPALASWFTSTAPPLGAELADRSEAVATLVSAFLGSLEGHRRRRGPGVVDARARWVVRVLTSLLIFPGHDADDERRMLEEFVVPVVLD